MTDVSALAHDDSGDGDWAVEVNRDSIAALAKKFRAAWLESVERAKVATAGLDEVYAAARGDSRGDDLDAFMDAQGDDVAFVVAYIKARLRAGQEDTDTLKRLGYLGPNAKPLPWEADTA